MELARQASERIRRLNVSEHVSVNAAKFSISIEPVRTERVFRCGEPAEMWIRVTDEAGKPADSGRLSLHFQNDFGTTVSRRELSLSNGMPVHVSETLAQPAFLTLTAVFESETAVYSANGELSANGEEALTFSETAGFAFEPEKITPGQEMPSDFLPFWKGCLARQNALADVVRLEEVVSHSTGSMAIFRVTVPTLDGECRFGWLALPKKKPGPFPAIVMVPGAGPGSGPVRSRVSKGTAVLVLNVFPYPADLDPARRRVQFEDFEREQCGGRRYVWKNAEDRETYFHRNSILAACRAVEFLASMPEVDASRIGFSGVSQGGFYGLALAALSPHLSAVVSSIPGYCDHGAAFAGRAPGGSKLYENVHDPAVLRVGPYFDGVNFARFVRTPIRMTVGFRDPVCDPSTVYAAFNQIPANDKAVAHELLLGHETGEKHSLAQEWLRQRLGIPE